MTAETPTRLADYTPPAFLVETVELTFRLAPRDARVRARIRFRPNPQAAPGQDLWLDGRALRLIEAAIDGQALSPNEMEMTAEGLRVPAARLPEGGFDWTCETGIDPEANTALEGLYMSKGMYCTQCEAEGFRKITYYPDRPDVMAVYTVRIEAPADGSTPVLLSNGNPGETGETAAVWHDPWPKPAYLFALVAGDLRAVRDRFTTRSGREVALAVWVRPGDEDRCGYALDALKRSMRWDEEVYGREYDLDMFNIVAVDDFNMGAMENKGLNIFNSRYVLASPETATDADYANIESIVAHEYFHNWTGNRVTCRDWFQLSLKEGLTVFRDQQFSEDMRSAAVERIASVQALRARQFREDAGPLAHPVRPAEYVEINNFYTATVYEKGAEIIRMLRNLVGAEGYARALDLYFERHDGQACTIEDWLAVFEEATGRDLSRFKLWYSQAGTPVLHVVEDWDGSRYTLAFRQETPPTPGQPEKAPVVIPIAYGLIGGDGRDLVPPGVHELRDAESQLAFDLPERPVPSILRGFSAPVILDLPLATEARGTLMAHDPDLFNRWEAGQALARTAIIARAGGAKEDADGSRAAWLHGAETLALDDNLEPAFRSLALGLPAEDGLAAGMAQAGLIPDPSAIHAARRDLHRELAQRLAPRLPELLAGLRLEAPYRPDAAQSGRRALSGMLIRLASLIEPHAATASAAYAAAGNMTETLAALSALTATGQGAEELADFAARWRHDRLVMDKWFGLQAGHTPPDAAIEVARGLTGHPDFDWKNPNRFRSVIGAFAGNTAAFHAADGAGYGFVADWLMTLDPVNPQTAARMLGVFETWRRYDAERQGLMRGELARIAATDSLSRNSREMVERMLAD